MNDQRFDKVAGLFLRASSLDAPEREAFLARLGKDDPELHREVATLLRCADRPPEVLRTGSMIAETGVRLEPIPDRIGNYRVIERIGEGGMGVVYRAEQETPIRRVVALKLLQSGIESRRVIARFESERQVLALMNHPNIAQVFDAGTTVEGRPYIAMEYVDGQPITEYCTRRRLSSRSRLALLMQVCEGVQHAHRNAIIHRDLKPSNVLVHVDGGKAVPKIIDFGIAKVLDNRVTQLTEIGQLVGTLEYMSPEQMLLDGRNVDSRADVYALGVLLYELLTGVRPWEIRELRGTSYDEICRRMRENDPPRPSVRVAQLQGAGGALPERRSDGTGPARRLRGDLDWITMRALEKDPERRYPSPSDLAADLARHLSHEPVLAGPPGLGYRLRRLARKHRLAVGLISLLFVTLVGFTLTAAFQASRIAREAERAAAEARTAAEVSEFLLGMFETTRPIPRRGRSSAQATLDASVEKVRNELGGRPILQARLLLTMGNAYGKQGLHRKALDLLEESRETLAQQLGAAHPTTLSAAESLANVTFEMGRYADAEPILVDALRARQASDPAHPDTFRSMANLANLYKQWGKSDESVPLFEEAIEGFEALLGRDHPDRLVATGLLVGVYLDVGRYDTAVDLLPDLIERMLQAGENDEATIAMYNLGCAYANLGNTREALHFLGAAIERGFHYPGSMLQDRHLLSLYENPEFTELERRSRLNNDMGWEPLRTEVELAVRRGDFAGAEQLLEELLSATARVRGSRVHRDSKLAMYRLVELWLSQRRFGEAEPFILEILELARTDPLMIPGDEARSLWYLAQCHIARGDNDRAIRTIDQSLEARWLNKDSEFHAYAEAMRLALAGELEGALHHLELAVDRGYADAEWMTHDMAFESLRQEARFKALVARIDQRSVASPAS